MLRISRDDLQPVLSTHHGTDSLRSAVQGARTPPHFLSVMARYIQFNSAFGPGLANLAGEVAARQGLFRDPDEPVVILADRAAEVAADFFYAAVDEFDRGLFVGLLIGEGSFGGDGKQPQVYQRPMHTIWSVPVDDTQTMNISFMLVDDTDGRDPEKIREG